MAAAASSAAALRELRRAVQYWSDFVAKCLAQRLDTDTFRDFAPLAYEKHPLPPVIVADLFFKPQLGNDVSLDPRMPPYIQVLTQLGYVDAPSILLVLYRYSSLHTRLQQHTAGHPAHAQPSRHGDARQPRRWKISSWLEEVMFYHVIKIVIEGTAIRDARSFLVLVRILCQWMHLFTSASAAFGAHVLGEMQQNSQARDDMDVSRAAFIPLLLRLVESPDFVKIIGRPLAKGE